MGKREVLIAGACRTPIGKMGGSLSSLSAAGLGALVIREALARAGVEGSCVDEVLMGCVIQAGLGQNVARQAAMGAGLPVDVPATTLNAVCGSGLECVNKAAALIRAGEAEVVVAGGAESMSNAPYLVQKGRFGYRLGNGELVDAMVNDALTDAFDGQHMMVTAENVCREWGLTRAELDSFAADSQQKCERARGKGLFAAETVPVEVPGAKGATVLVEADEAPRPGTTVEGLARLHCVSGVEEGLVTAGNSSGINDGASALVLMSAEAASRLGAKPQARWVAGSLAGVRPEVMGMGPVAAVRRLLAKTGLAVDDFDLIEANEAFAAQSLAVGRELGWDWARVNVNGGAIALGHPVGASGARILTRLVHEMQRRGVQRGLATLCIGGGMGSACAIELA